MVAATIEGFEHAGGRTGLLGPLEPDAGHGDVVLAVDEVLLKPHLGPVRQLQPGAERDRR